MRRMRPVTVTLGAALAAGLTLAPSPSSAQTSDEYARHLAAGTLAAAAGNTENAAQEFGLAVQTDPSRPEAVCLLAQAHRLRGDLAGALDSFGSCAQVARTAGDARWTARAMHGLASTLERMPERLGEARAAWLDYVRFADGAAAVTTPQVGRARVTAVDVVQELERVTAQVRDRIAERERAGAAAPGGRTP